MTMRQVNLTYPMFDGHVHLRGVLVPSALVNLLGGWDAIGGGDPHDRLERVVKYTARQCFAAVAEPNTSPPITSGAQSVAYADVIEARAEQDGYPDFRVIRSLYLTDRTTEEMLDEAIVTHEVGHIKVYLRGVTTGSQSGVENLLAPHIKERLQLAAFRGVPVEIHLEDVNEPQMRWREARAIPWAVELATEIPELQLIIAHLSSKEGVELIKNGPENLWCNITPHHLWGTVDDIFLPTFNSAHCCLPILKDPEDRAALIELAVSGHERVFAGTDSAPHGHGQKCSYEAPAGCFVAAHAVEMYATTFHEHAGRGWREKLEYFQTEVACRLFGEALPERTLELEQNCDEPEWEIPEDIEGFRPFGAGRKLPFRAHRRKPAA